MGDFRGVARREKNIHLHLSFLEPPLSSPLGAIFFFLHTVCAETEELLPRKIPVRIGVPVLVLSSMASQSSRMRVQHLLTSRTKLNQLSQRGVASRTSPRLKVKTDSISPLYRFGGVHGGASHQKTWRNKPLFRREVRTDSTGLFSRVCFATCACTCAIAACERTLSGAWLLCVNRVRTSSQQWKRQLQLLTCAFFIFSIDFGARFWAGVFSSKQG